MAEKEKGGLIKTDDHVILVGGKGGHDLKLERTVDRNGVVFYEAKLDWRNPEPE